MNVPGATVQTLDVGGTPVRVTRAGAGRDLVYLHSGFGVVGSLTLFEVLAGPIVAGSLLGGWLAAELAVWYPERMAAIALLAPLGLHVAGAPVFEIFGRPTGDAAIAGILP